MADVGTVTFRCAGSDVRAVLREDHTWKVICDHSEIAGAVRPILDEIAARDHGPADGFYGPRQLDMAAEAFAGTVVEQAEIEDDPGTIY